MIGDHIHLFINTMYLLGDIETIFKKGQILGILCKFLSYSGPSGILASGRKLNTA